MSKRLPDQPSLEHLKNESKDLLRRARAGEQSALSRLESPRLSFAQLAVAREYGFSSWSKLKRFVEGYTDVRDAFFSAIAAGDRGRVTELLADGPALVHARSPHHFGAPPLNIAAGRNDVPMIELLLGAGADINARSDWWAGSFGPLDFSNEETSKLLLRKGARLTPHAAARLGMADELEKMIVENPELVNERGGDGQMPLHFAKDVRIVDILLDAGADIEARDLDHEGTPAQTHVVDKDILSRLAERGAKLDIFSAIALEDLDTLTDLLEKDPEGVFRRTDEPGNPMIPQAAGAHRYTYNLGRVRPYQAAVNLGSRRALEVVLARSMPEHRIIAAAWEGDQERARALAREHPGATSDAASAEPTLLCDAAKARRVEAVRTLLDLGFEVNARDCEGMSAVYWAAFLGYDEIVESLLPYRPDLETKNRYGGTALSGCIYGAEHGWGSDGNHARCVKLLAEAGAVLPERVWGTPAVRRTLAELGVPT